MSECLPEDGNMDTSSGHFSQHSHQHTRQASVASVLCGGSTEFQDELSSTAGKPYQVRARIYMRPF